MKLTGPIEDGTWPDRLSAHVVTPDATRIHGYDIATDLVRHYRFAEVLYLSLSGELPDEATGRTFEGLLTLLAPVAAGEAAVHAGMVARLQGAVPSSVTGVAALGLGELATQTLEDHAELFTWLADDRAGEVPGRFGCRNAGERAHVSDVMESVGLPPEVGDGLAYVPALLAGLHHCGLGEEQIHLCLVVARLPVAVAEALAVRPGSFREYPMRLPEFVYEEGP